MSNELKGPSLTAINGQLGEIQELLQTAESRTAGLRRAAEAIVSAHLGPGIRIAEGLTPEVWTRLDATRRDQVATALDECIDELRGTSRKGLLSGAAVPAWVTLVFAGVVVLGAWCLVQRVVDRWDDAVAPAPIEQVAALRDSTRSLATARGARDRERSEFVDASRAAGEAELARATGELAVAEQNLTANESEVAGQAEELMRAFETLPSESRVIEMVALLGALGGVAHLLTSFAKYVGLRRLWRSWLLYYSFLPLQGALLATIVYLVLRVGILAPSGMTDGGAGNLNLVGIYAFAGLTGLFSKVALDKLAEVFQTIFKTDRVESRLESLVEAALRPAGLEGAERLAAAPAGGSPAESQATLEPEGTQPDSTDEASGAASKPVAKRGSTKKKR